MDQNKEAPFFTQSDVHDLTPDDNSEKLGTEWDRRGMVRMGKKQELRREFQFQYNRLCYDTRMLLGVRLDVSSLAQFKIFRK
jgi:hypothetical protein